MNKRSFSVIRRTPSAEERRWPALHEARIERAMGRRWGKNRGTVKKPEATAPVERVRADQSVFAVVLASIALWWSMIRDLCRKVILR